MHRKSGDHRDCIHLNENLGIDIEKHVLLMGISTNMFTSKNKAAILLVI